MKDRCSRTGIAHGGRQHAQYNTVGGIVVLQQNLIATHTHIGGDIITLRITYEWMKIQPIDGLQRALLNILVRPVHRVTRLKADDPLPAALGKARARLFRRITMPGEDLFLQGHDAYRTAKQDIALLIDDANAWMLLLLVSIDLPC